VRLGVEERALAKKQHALQEKVERADDRYSNLETAIGALQIAIVLASLSIVAAATWLLGGSSLRCRWPGARFGSLAGALHGGSAVLRRARVST